MKYPCENCLVKAACNNLKCTILEDYLTSHYKEIPILTSKKIKIYRNTTPSNLKKAMSYFNKTRERGISVVFFLFIKDDIYKLTRTTYNTIEIKGIEH